jgi:integrase
MTKSIAKKGRPTAYYRTSWGEKIDGLARLADGRWKVSGPDAVKYTEPDERLAVARFREIEAKRNPQSNIGHAKAHATWSAVFKDVMTRAHVQGGSVKATIEQPSVNDGLWVVTDDSLSDAQWAWLREKILTQPKWVAQRVGIEKLGWLEDAQRPTPSPTLKQIGELYANKPGLSINEAGRSRLFWNEFVRVAGIATVRELTHEHVGAYEKKITGNGLSPKSILHRYRKVRTILAYAIKRGQGVEDCRRALDITAMLEIKNHTPLDPHPIKPVEFWKIHKAAVEAGDDTFAAMLLTSINAAMYGGEVSALKWDEIDLSTGELVTRRPKTSVSRVACLWPETLKAIKAIPRRGDYIFNTCVRSYTVWSCLDSWRKYRRAAGLGAEITFGMLRDAGFSIACTVSLDQARVLAGHRLPGASDHYLRRQPQFVAPACQAIHDAFYAPTAKGKRSH